ncbi:MAG: hypothetical protein IJJ85_01610 [Clostridia bacterium]|nr:hypothetical protein [Clostridia bacterium]
MAAYCPKCNYKLRLRDWRAECPECGVNILYYGIEDRLREEADAAEYHHAIRQPKYDRLKFSLIGHKLSIVRLAIGLLPIAALLLPSGSIRLDLPFGVQDVTVNLISIIKFFSSNGLDFDALTALMGSRFLGSAMVAYAAALVGTLLIALIALVGWILLTLSCSPRGMRRNIGFPCAGIAAAVIAFVSYCVMVSRLNAAVPGVFAGTVLPFAFIAVVLCFAAMIAVNVIYKKKGIEVKYKDVSELLLPYNERPSTIEKQKGAKACAAVPKEEDAAKSDITEEAAAAAGEETTDNTAPAAAAAEG